jgi:hypothetical protein
MEVGAFCRSTPRGAAGASYHCSPVNLAGVVPNKRGLT